MCRFEVFTFEATYIFESLTVTRYIYNVVVEINTPINYDFLNVMCTLSVKPNTESGIRKRKIVFELFNSIFTSRLLTLNYNKFFPAFFLFVFENNNVNWIFIVRVRRRCFDFELRVSLNMGFGIPVIFNEDTGINLHGVNLFRTFFY